MMSLYCYFHPLMSEGFYAQVCEKAKTDEIWSHTRKVFESWNLVKNGIPSAGPHNDG